MLFNGYISTNPIDVGGGYIAFNIEGGEEKVEMPLILCKSTLTEYNSNFKIGDLISASGVLEKIQGEWVIKAKEILNVPSLEEEEKLL